MNLSTRVEESPPKRFATQAVVRTQTSFGVSYKQATSSVRKFTRAPEYNESFSVKIYKNTEEVTIKLMHYRKGLDGKLLGYVEISLADPNSARRRWHKLVDEKKKNCLLYTSPSPRDRQKSRMPSSA